MGLKLCLLGCFFGFLVFRRFLLCFLEICCFLCCVAFCVALIVFCGAIIVFAKVSFGVFFFLIIARVFLVFRKCECCFSCVALEMLQGSVVSLISVAWIFLMFSVFQFVLRVVFSAITSVSIALLRET